jgi:hypothetical protein
MLKLVNIIGRRSHSIWIIKWLGRCSVESWVVHNEVFLDCYIKRFGSWKNMDQEDMQAVLLVNILIHICIN